MNTNSNPAAAPAGLPPLTQRQLDAAALAKVTHALACIQRAQEELSRAVEALSALNGGVPVWTAGHKLYDQVHKYWYRVDSFRNGGKFSLDRANVEALQRAIAASGNPA